MKNLYDKREAEMINNLKSLEVPPPSGLWDHIDATLKVRSRRRIIIISSWASAATIALLFTIGGIYSIRSKVEIIATSNQIGHSTLISDKNDIVKNQLSIPKIDQTGYFLNAESKTQQIVTENSAIETTEVDSTEIKERILIPARLEAFQPTISTSKTAAPNKIKISNHYNKINYSYSTAMADPIMKKNKGNWYISASGFPVYSFHSSGVLNKTGTQQQSGIVSWGGSLAVRYALTDRFSIETGISYSIMGQKEKDLYLVYSDSKNIELYNNSEFANNYGTLAVSTPDYKVMDIRDANNLSYAAVNESVFMRVDASQRFRYLEVPLILSKEVNYKGFNLYFKGGGATGLIVQNLLDIRGSNIHLKGKTTGVYHYTASILASIGVTIPISNKVNLLIEPSFKLGLRSLSNENGKSFPFSSYIKFGVEIPI